MVKKTPIESRLKPPPELKTVNEKRLFESLISAYSGDFFNVGDLPLLINYVRSKLSSDRLHKEVIKHGEVTFDKHGNQVPSAFFKAFNMSCSTMATLSQKLRLAPSARMRQEAPGASAKKSSSNRDFNPLGDWRDHKNK